MKPIYFFVKFCEKEQYARAFVAGRLWMNPLAYFKGLEDHKDGRTDRHEAPLAWHQPSALGSIQIGSISIPPSELAGPVVLQDTAADFINVLCLYAAAAPFDKVSSENLQAFNEHLQIPGRCRTMGGYAVVVHRSAAFIRRVVEAAEAQRLALEGGLVSYFDPDSFSGNFDHAVFAKKRDYAWQREYRLAIDRKAASPEPFVFDVGPLGELCTIVKSEDLGEVTAVPPG